MVTVTLRLKDADTGKMRLRSFTVYADEGRYGYVFETTKTTNLNPQGLQVSWTLFHTGNMMSCKADEASLRREILIAQRRHLRVERRARA